MNRSKDARRAMLVAKRVSPVEVLQRLAMTQPTDNVDSALDVARMRMAKAPMARGGKSELMKIFRGESRHNKGGNFYSSDREFARNFTQSGRDAEIMSHAIDRSHVYIPPSPVYAGDERGVTNALNTAKERGFKAVQLHEGDSEPPSVFVFDKSAVKRSGFAAGGIPIALPGGGVFQTFSPQAFAPAQIGNVAQGGADTWAPASGFPIHTPPPVAGTPASGTGSIGDALRAARMASVGIPRWQQKQQMQNAGPLNTPESTAAGSVFTGNDQGGGPSQGPGQTTSTGDFAGTIGTGAPVGPNDIGMAPGIAGLGYGAATGQQMSPGYVGASMISGLTGPAGLATGLLGMGLNALGFRGSTDPHALSGNADSAGDKGADKAGFAGTLGDPGTKEGGDDSGSDMAGVDNGMGMAGYGTTGTGNEPGGMYGGDMAGDAGGGSDAGGSSDAGGGADAGGSASGDSAGAGAGSNARGGRIEGYAGGGDVDYRGEHEAPGPDSGAPLHDTAGVYPPDFYGPNGFRYYADLGNDYDRDSYYAATRVKGNPDAKVWVHRAIPKSAYAEAMKAKDDAPINKMIRNGDWVTPSKAYAHEHGEAQFGKNYKVVSRLVKARHVFTNGDSIHEWGYHRTEDRANGGSVKNRSHDGRLLQDQYPTHYMPHVGRQVMADGGYADAEEPFDPANIFKLASGGAIDRALSIAHNAAKKGRHVPPR